MATATAQAVQLLNLAYFGRPADPASLTGWSAAGLTQNQVVEAFVSTSEYKTGTINVTSTESGGVRTYNMTSLINKLYNRLVGRDAAASEITGWSNAVSSGAVNHDYLGITLVNAILNLDESVEMRQVMMAKLDSANLYSDYLSTNAADLSAYSTTAGLASGVAFNDSVTTTTAKTYAEVVAVADLLDNPAKYTLSAAAVSAAEGDALTFAVTLDSAPTEAVTVNYVTANGSATSADYTSASGTVTFAAGQTTQYVTVQTTEDTTFEEDETISVTFSGTRLNASVTAAGTITNDDVNPTTAAQTLTLTTGSDTLTSLDGDDTFDASANNTLTTFDTLVGGGGTDTLNATLTAPANLPLNTTGIEQINLTVASAAASSVNFEHTSGVTGITSVNSIGDLTLQNIQSAITSIKIQNGTAESLTVDYDAAAISGTADDALITLDDVVSNNVVFSRDPATTNTLETVSLHSISEANTVNDLQTTAVGTTTLEVTGDQALTITTALDNEVTTVSAGSFTGALTLTTGTGGVTVTGGSGADSLTGGTGADSITGGSGADTITSAAGNDTVLGGAGADRIVHASGNDNLSGEAGDDVFVTANDGNGDINVTTDDTISGGAGTDTLELGTDGTTAADAVFTNLTSIETVTSTAGSRMTLLTLGTLAEAAGVNTVTFNDSTAADRVTIGADFTSNLTVNLAADTTGADTVDGSAYTGVLTVVAEADELDSQAHTLTGGTGTSDVLTIAGGGNAIVAADTANYTAIETYRITGATTNIALELSTGNAADGATLTVDASALTTGTADIDASRETDGILVITTGAANDSVNASISDNGDNITLGAGNDTVLIKKDGNSVARLTADDTISGGAGTDVIELTDDATTLADAGFTNVTSVETLTATSGSEIHVTLGSLAAAAGLATVTLNDTTATDTVTVGAGFTNNLTVNLDGDDTLNTVDASAYTGVLTVVAEADELDTTATAITGGTGSSDVLQIATGGAALVAADFASITKVETFQFTGNSNQSLTLSDNNAGYTHASDYVTLTVDASGLTTGVATIDATAEADSKVVILGGGAADVITATASVNFGDSINAGAGNDTIHLSADGVLTNIDTIDGGAGTDTLSIVANSTIADAAFTNVSNIETITGGTNIEFTSLTLGSQANSSGIATVTMAGNAASKLVVDSGFTQSLTVNTTAATVNDTVDASASAAAITIVSAAANIGASDSLKGGTGTGDSMTLTPGDDTATLTGISGIETINIAYADADITLTMGANDTQIAAGATLTVDASLMTETDETLTFNGTASETDGFLNITGSAAGDTISGGGAADTISGGLGADSITGGAGADSLTGGGGADIFVYTAVSQSNSTATDTLADFTSGTDKLHATLDYSALTTAQTVNATVVTAAAGVTAVQNSLSAERGQFIHDTTNNKVYINVNNDNLITSLDYSFNSTTALADGDINFTISGGTSDDTITAGSGADIITGGAGADSITAGAGNDTITGGAGDDVLAGGLGANTFIFGATATANGADTLTGTTSDIFDLSAFETAGAVVAASATHTLADGVVIALGGADAGAADGSAAAITALNAAGTATDAAKTVYVAISDNNSTAFYQVLGNGGGNEFTGDTFTLLATHDQAFDQAALVAAISI